MGFGLDCIGCVRVCSRRAAGGVWFVTNKLSSLVSNLAIAALLVAACLSLAYLLLGCDGIGVNSDVNVKLEGYSVCKGAYPECTTIGPACVDTAGHFRRDCSVTCLAARELVCSPDAGIPDCLQLVGDIEDPTVVHVPIYCVSND